MRAVMILGRTILAGACLLLVAGCAGGPSKPSGAANDPPLPQPAGVSPPPSVPSSTAPVTVASPSPAPSPAHPSRVEKPEAPLQTSSGAPVTTSAEDSESSDTSTAFDNVEWVNPNLAAKLNILRVGSNRTDDNLLSVFVGLKNKTSRVLQVDVQTIYKDKSGQSLSEGTGNWIPMNMKPHEEVQYRSVAISEDATDFLVRIRRAVPAAPAVPAGSGQ